MRPELRDLEAHRAPISEHEIGFTLDICDQIVQSHWSATHRGFENAPLDDEVNEALSDQNFRTAYQVQFVWQMGLWRMLALLDGILSQWFPELDDQSLTKKVRSLGKAGVTLPTPLRSELHQWIDLRNILSHGPPEAPSFSHQLERQDLEAFANLANDVLVLARPQGKFPPPEV